MIFFKQLCYWVILCNIEHNCLFANILSVDIIWLVWGHPCMGQRGFNDEISIGRKVACSVFKAADLVICSEEIEYCIKDQVYQRVLTIGRRPTHISNDHLDILPSRFGAKLLDHLGR